MLHRALLIIVLFCSAAYADYEESPTENSPFRLSDVTFTGVPSYAWNDISTWWGDTLSCHIAAWDGEVFLVEATYCIGEGETGWEPIGSSEFFSLYNRLDGIGDYRTAPSTSTTVGNMQTLYFDLDQPLAEGHQCIGLFKEYERMRQNLFEKTLTLYVCNDGPWALTDEAFRGVLRGLSLDGEFTSLIP